MIILCEHCGLPLAICNALVLFIRASDALASENLVKSLQLSTEAFAEVQRHERERAEEKNK